MPILDILYSLVDSSIHPVSVGIKEYLISNYKDLKHIELNNINQIPAIGLEATYQNHKIFGGKIEDDQIDTTTFNFTIDDKPIITFYLQDKIKDDAKQTIDYLHNENIEVIMCSGDNEKVAQKVANSVGIKNIKANMKPQEKADFISKLKDQNKSVIMVGDGINDALALSRADISIAMGSGADISLAISDIVILNDKISGLQTSIYISKRTFAFIKQNLTISLIYNMITIPVAIAGYVIPLVAALSMSISSLLVVGNSMRIKNKKI
jgi:Cu+-exporting ATPase